MTPIDAFDTMKLMKLDKQANEAKTINIRQPFIQ